MCAGYFASLFKYAVMAVLAERVALTFYHKHVMKALIQTVGVNTNISPVHRFAMCQIERRLFKPRAFIITSQKWMVGA